MYNASQCYLYINGTETPCNEWVYDTSVYTSTLVTKFNMVCQNKVYSSIILLAHFLGTTVNALLCGLASDKNVPSYTPQSYTTMDAKFGSSWNLPIFIRWRQLHLSNSTIYHCFVPESPRWLLSKGRTEQAILILHKMAKCNRIDIQFDPQDITLSGDYMATTLERLKIIMSKEMLTRIFVLSFNGFAINLAYYSISMNTGELRGDPYINYLLSATVDFIALLFCFFAEKFPRKKWYCPAMIIGGSACISTIFTSIYGGKSSKWLTIALAMVGKLGVFAGSFGFFLITTEVFPTVVRASAFGLCTFLGRFGGTVSSFIAKPGVLFEPKYGMGLPLLICGLFVITGGLLVLFLPETRKIELPESVKDVLPSKSKFTRLDETTYIKASIETIEMCNVNKDQ